MVNPTPQPLPYLHPQPQPQPQPLILTVTTDPRYLPEALAHSASLALLSAFPKSKPHFDAAFRRKLFTTFVHWTSGFAGQRALDGGAAKAARGERQDSPRGGGHGGHSSHSERDSPRGGNVLTVSERERSGESLGLSRERSVGGGHSERDSSRGGGHGSHSGHGGHGSHGGSFTFIVFEEKGQGQGQGQEEVLRVGGASGVGQCFE